MRKEIVTICFLGVLTLCTAAAQDEITVSIVDGPRSASVTLDIDPEVFASLEQWRVAQEVDFVEVGSVLQQVERYPNVQQMLAGFLQVKIREILKVFETTAIVAKRQSFEVGEQELEDSRDGAKVRLP